MHEWTSRLAGDFVSANEELEREFDARLVESARLAFRVAFSVLRHREDAEDVAQDAFAKAHRHFRQLRDPERFERWLVRMVWRMALDRRRGDHRRSIREAEHERTRPPSSTDNAADERARMLWEAIDALPDKLRHVVVLASIEGHDLGAVARLLGIPQGTVKSRLFLARQRIKDQLAWMNETASIAK
ncbi:MAG TPA: sigma-70 family RNA polymerase sigma factor [Vicinamibacterales bacterium]|nr:sigma-70 family RNA polymerase sigma factor [Vicinamibacterales bacterium]